MRNMIRRVSRWSIALVTMAVTVTIGGAPAAHAAATATCAGTSTISYQPGLTLTPRAVHYAETDTFSGCVSTDATLTSGTSSSSVDLPAASCLALPSVVNDPAFTIYWNNGQQTVVDLTFTDVIIGGTEQITGTGPVVAGEFLGGNATVVWLYPVVNLLDCLSSQGLTSQNGILAAQITML